jgi:cell division protein FtsB
VNTDLLTHPFTLGFGLGVVFLILALYQLFRLKGELKRYKRHLSDKLEIEADAMKKVKKERESLLKENENLRVKVASLSDLPERRIQRDLEVYARAERRMLVSVPGFAPAWESAKAEAVSDLEAEDAGRSLPKRVFGKWFGGQGKDEAEKPQQASTVQSLPSGAEAEQS